MEIVQMEYQCLGSESIAEGDYQLVPIRHQDMPLIKTWRNAQMHYLRQAKPLTDAMQETYYRDQLLPAFALKEPPQLLFSLLEKGQCIAYGGLVHIDWTALRAEVSFLMETARAQNPDVYSAVFALFLQLIKQITFERLHFHRLYTETFDIRPLHLSVLEQSGFVFEGRMKEHVKIAGKFVDALLHGCLNVHNI
jgi:RimJ/RimL family protein N-acetyltransferase